MEAQTLKTVYKARKDAFDLLVYNEYNQLISTPGAMALAVEDVLMKKYNIHARSTIWSIRRRVTKRISESPNQECHE